MNDYGYCQNEKQKPKKKTLKVMNVYLSITFFQFHIFQHFRGLMTVLGRFAGDNHGILYGVNRAYCDGSQRTLFRDNVSTGLLHLVGRILSAFWCDRPGGRQQHVDLKTGCSGIQDSGPDAHVARQPTDP